jgi:hypothetical protein
VAVAADRHAELRFELLQVLVMGAEEAFDPFFGDRDLARRGGGDVEISFDYVSLRLQL